MFALFDVTKRCNLTCKYCGNDSNLGFEDKLDLEEITAALRKMEENGVGVVSFSGGEVFMRDDFMDVLEECEELGLDVKINTNGTLVTDDIARKLSTFDSIFEVRVSLDASEKEINDELRPDSFERIVDGIENLVSYDLPVSVVSVLNKNNYGNVSDHIDFVRDLGADCLHFFLQTEFGRGWDVRNMKLDEEEEENARDIISVRKNELGRESPPSNCGEESLFLHVLYDGSLRLYRTSRLKDDIMDGTKTSKNEAEGLDRTVDEIGEVVGELVDNNSNAIPECENCDVYRSMHCKLLHTHCFGCIVF